MTYSILNTAYGWAVLATDDGVSSIAATTGTNGALAASIRDWLTNADRIADLLDRHGLVDVPLDSLDGP